MDFCLECGADLPPEVNFCRHCGAAVGSGGGFSESPTAQLHEIDDKVSTRRLQPRPTTPGPGLRTYLAKQSHSALPPVGPSPITNRRKFPLAVMLLVVVLVTATAIVCVALLRTGRKTILNSETTTATSALIYPNSQMLLDTTTASGRVIQLQTSDSTDQVAAWYTAKITPTKTVRLASSTVVLKSADTTVTIVSADDKTNVLIKQANPE